MGVILSIIHGLCKAAWKVVSTLIRGVELEGELLRFSCLKSKIDMGSIIADIGIIPLATIGIIVGKAGVHNLPSGGDKLGKSNVGHGTLSGVFHRNLTGKAGSLW